jgi:creatinine amidohydrolase
MAIENIIWLRTENPDFKFEDNGIGRIKKSVWDADEAQLDKWLKEDFGIPSPSELGKPNCYVQTTPRHRLAERRKKNDIVFLPIGCSENHGAALATGQDVFQITQFLEGVRRYTAKKGYEVNLAFPITYGGHPAHHLGMPGTVVMPHEILMEQIIHIMLGLWNDGFRKIILVNNHGHQWTLSSAVQEFCKRFSLPGIFQVFDFPTTVREFFIPGSGKGDEWKEPFTHAGESETSLGLLMFPDMVDMDYAEDGTPKSLFKKGWFDNSITDYGRPHQWYEGEGHSAWEISATRNGVVGLQKLSEAKKAKRPVTAMCKLMVELVDNILELYPAGKVPPVEETTLRSAEEMAPYLQEPLSKGWKSVYALPKIGPF